jgi:hypothetical protein
MLSVEGQQHTDSRGYVRDGQHSQRRAAAARCACSSYVPDDHCRSPSLIRQRNEIEAQADKLLRNSSLPILRADKPSTDFRTVRGQTPAAATTACSVCTLPTLPYNSLSTANVHPIPLESLSFGLSFPGLDRMNSLLKPHN